MVRGRWGRSALRRRLDAAGKPGRPTARARPGVLSVRAPSRSLAGGTVERRHSLRSHTIRLVALAAALACRPADRASRPPRDAGYTVTDDAGRTVALAQPARRIVSLSPAVTELLFALGVGDRVVGRTTWCDYPPLARLVPSVGDGLNPNLEAVAARRPDLVVLYRSPLNETAAAQLGRLGVPAAGLGQDRLRAGGRAPAALGPAAPPAR